MDAYLQLRCWPDVPAALDSLKSAGLRLAFLSNMTAPMLQAGIRNSRLEGLFDRVLSTDRVRVYKPDPRAYHMALDAFRLERHEILFSAFAGWDAAGARSFGYPTFWVNRLKQPAGARNRRCSGRRRRESTRSRRLRARAKLPTLGPRNPRPAPPAKRCSVNGAPLQLASSRKRCLP